jgi:hypothetical protein
MATNYNRALRESQRRTEARKAPAMGTVDVSGVIKALSEESKFGRLKWLTPHPSLVDNIVPKAAATQSHKGFWSALLHRFKR